MKKECMTNIMTEILSVVYVIKYIFFIYVFTFLGLTSSFLPWFILFSYPPSDLTPAQYPLIPLLFLLFLSPSFPCNLLPPSLFLFPCLSFLSYPSPYLMPWFLSCSKSCAQPTSTTWAWTCERQRTSMLSRRCTRFTGRRGLPSHRPRDVTSHIVCYFLPVRPSPPSALIPLTLKLQMLSCTFVFIFCYIKQTILKPQL